MSDVRFMSYITPDIDIYASDIQLYYITSGTAKTAQIYFPKQKQN